MEQTEDAETSPHTYSYLTFYEGVKKHDGEKIVSSTNGAVKTG
jgi:hypothetical protein